MSDENEMYLNTAIYYLNSFVDKPLVYISTDTLREAIRVVLARNEKLEDALAKADQGENNDNN